MDHCFPGICIYTNSNLASRVLVSPRPFASSDVEPCEGRSAKSESSEPEVALVYKALLIFFIPLIWHVNISMVCVSPFECVAVVLLLPLDKVILGRRVEGTLETKAWFKSDICYGFDGVGYSHFLRVLRQDCVNIF